MDKLKIPIDLDDKQARAAIRRLTGDVRAEAKDGTAVVEQAASDRTKADKDAAKAAAKAAKELAAERVRAERTADREIERLFADTARTIKQGEKDIERQVKQSAAEKTRAEKEHYGKLVAGAKEATRVEKMMAQEAENAQKKQAGMVEGLMGISTAMIGLQSASQFFALFTQHFDKIRMDAYQAAEDVMRMRGAVRELAALRGDLGKTGETLTHVGEISAQTLQKPEESQQMLEAGLGIGELAIGEGGTMTKEEFDKAIIAAGKMHTMEGGPAKAYGAMVGQLALSSKGKMTAEDMQAKLSKMFAIQQPGGFENFGQAAAQYARVQPLVQSGVLSPEQAMGLLSAMSIASPEEAGTMVEQFTRATMAGRLRERGMKVPEGVEAEKSAEYMKSIGADKLSDPIEIGMKIADDLKAQEAKAVAKGQKFDTYGYLQTHGFVNQQDINTVMLFSSMRNRGRLKKIEEAETTEPERGSIDKHFEQRVSKDPFLQGRAAELAEQLATMKQGVENEALRASRRAAFARLKQHGKISGSFDEWEKTGATQATLQDIQPWAPNYHSQVDVESDQYLEMERRRLGLARPHAAGSEQYRRELANSVRDAGGNVTLGVMDQLKEAAADLKEAAREQKAVSRKPTEAMVPRPSGRF
jgi:hypothetical protein